MGESDCLMQPFSYVTGVINGAQGNPLHALGESISFGRFASESLAWERWSSFSSNGNRYVEEAKNYSRPGSVAQKKAFFEAHYKSIAAKKAAALLEQANANANNVPEPEFVDSSHDNTAHDSQATVSISDTVVDQQLQLKVSNTAHDSHATVSISDEQLQVKASNRDAGCSTSANRDHFNVAEEDKLEAGKVEEADPVTNSQVLSEKSMNFELPTEVGETQNYLKVTELESSKTSQLEKPILKSSNSNHEGSALTSKKKPTASSKSANGTSRLPSSPARSRTSIHLRKENNATTVLKSSSEVSTFMSKMKPAMPPSPAKHTAAFHPRKEINSTPVRIKSTLDSWDRKRATPKALHISVNATPARKHNISTPPAPRNIGNSRVAGAAKASTNCSTPLGTPTTVSVNGGAKHCLATPRSETRRAKAPLHPVAAGSRTGGPKWHFPSSDRSSSSTASRNKLEYPILTSPFSFKTEERAAKRKEKLEERLNAKEEHRVLLQTRFKEKAETELRRLRQSLCFKARPLPDFYKERRIPKDQVTVKHSQSLNLGRKPNPCIVQRSTCLPPRKTSTSSKNGQTTARSSPSLTRMVTHENTSPNIQQ